MSTISGGVLVGAGTAIKQCGAVTLVTVLRVASAALGACRAGAVSFGVMLAKMPALIARSPGRRVSLRWPGRIAHVSAPVVANGPGESAGESLRDLPAVWQVIQLPAGYIGPNVAALALARGEAWERVGNRVLIAGRVLVGESGADVYCSDDAAARRLVALRYAEASVWLGMLAMQAGPLRDELISKRRDAVWTIAKRAAKAVPKVADIARRRALMADIDFALRGV